jgi:hypothetical protein
MSLVNPISTVTDAVKLIVLVICLAVGGYTIYKGGSFVTNYFTYKENAAIATKAANDQALENKKTAESHAVTDKVEEQVIVEDKVQVQKHQEKKKEVAQKVIEIEKQPDITPAEKETKVAAVYIDSLWTDYCDASQGSETQSSQCKNIQPPAVEPAT